MRLPHLPHPLQRIDQLFDNLCNFKMQQPTQEEQRDQSWIAADTWHVIDRRAHLRQRQVFDNAPGSAQREVNNDRNGELSCGQFCS